MVVAFYNQKILNNTLVIVINDKKITIVRGRNDVGKTNLLNVIRWCLYDEEAKDEVSSQEIYNEYAFLKFHPFIPHI